jgi:hypothetical protein
VDRIDRSVRRRSAAPLGVDVARPLVLGVGEAVVAILEGGPVGVVAILVRGPVGVEVEVVIDGRREPVEVTFGDRPEPLGFGVGDVERRSLVLRLVTSYPLLSREWWWRWK